MPPSVASKRLTNGVGGAMTKRHSHSFPEHFSTECCAKNTQIRMARSKARMTRHPLHFRTIFLRKFSNLLRLAGATDRGGKSAFGISHRQIRPKTKGIGPIPTRSPATTPISKAILTPRAKSFIGHRNSGNWPRRSARFAAAAPTATADRIVAEASAASR